MIHILGTSHVARDSVEHVKKQFEDIDPDIVALELDPGRVHALKNKAKRPKNLQLLRTIGFSGFLFYIVGELVQKKVGNIVNMEPGSEMLTALEIAEEEKKDIALIDRDIVVTLRRFSKVFRKREILSMAKDLVMGTLKKDKMEVDISKLPSDELIAFVLEQTKENYPSLYQVLVHERNVIMARRLYHLSRMHQGKKILAVVGAGHVPGMQEELKKLKGKDTSLPKE